ncbi:MAG: energy-coupled thiamine transporter ThiT, partial [Oscillospiraceae bacterium]
TLLSMIKIDMPMGGGVTLCAMLPLVVMSWRHGIKWGTFTAFVFSVLQMLLGLDNVRYATSALMAAAIILFDYIVAYTVIGLAGAFKGKLKNAKLELVAGVSLTLFARFLCHFITGWFIWDALWPNGTYIAPVYSLLYNGSYMLPELIITSVVALLLLKYMDYGMERK